jgi:hypothetical protein
MTNTNKYPLVRSITSMSSARALAMSLAAMACLAAPAIPSDVTAKVALEPGSVTTGDEALFRFTLDNSSGNLVEDVEVTLDFLDLAGASVPALFSVAVPVLNGIGAVDGSANLAPLSVATADFSVKALAGATPGPGSIRYRVSGTLVCRIEGELITRAFPAQGLQVFPGANLEVELYLPDSVRGDWAGTPGLVEESEPFSAGLVIRNTGAGAATALSILSGGPSFVPDPGGLALLAQITELELNNNPIEGGFTLGPAQLGDLAPGAELRLLWSLEGNRQADLSGLDLAIVHGSPIGGVSLATVASLSSETLVHSMLAVQAPSGPLDDGAIDFLVDEPMVSAPTDPITGLEMEAFPSLLRSSTGVDLPLTGIVLATLGPAPSKANLASSASVSVSTAGWHYTRFDNPGGHTFALAQVSRTTKALQFTGLEVGGPGDVSAVWTTARPLDLTGDGVPDIVRREVHVVDFFDTPGNYKYNLVYQETAAFALTADVEFLSGPIGGTQSLSLDAGPDHAGEFYLLLGSFSGTSPGTPAGITTLPLNIDPWFMTLLTSPSLQALFGTFGVLDANGQASSAIILPPGFVSGFGLSAHHAFVVIPPVEVISFASNAVPLFVLP